MLKWFLDDLYWFQIYKDQCGSVSSIPVAVLGLDYNSHYRILIKIRLIVGCNNFSLKKEHELGFIVVLTHSNTIMYTISSIIHLPLFIHSIGAQLNKIYAYSTYYQYFIQANGLEYMYWYFKKNFFGEEPSM